MNKYIVCNIKLSDEDKLEIIELLADDIQELIDKYPSIKIKHEDSININIPINAEIEPAEFALNAYNTHKSLFGLYKVNKLPKGTTFKEIK
jgi:hypothetical protein